MMSDPRRRRRRGLVKSVVALMVLAGVAALVTAAFRVGMAQGLAAAGGVLVVYAVPATIFDWPRLTLEDVMSALGALAAAIGAAFLALFDW
jgi:uncharacterized membrane protein YccC